MSRGMVLLIPWMPYLLCIPFLRHWRIGATRYPSGHIPRWGGQMEASRGSVWGGSRGGIQDRMARIQDSMARSTPSIHRYKYLYTRARARNGRDYGYGHILHIPIPSIPQWGPNPRWG